MHSFVLFCFEQVHLKNKQKFEFPFQLVKGEKQLSLVVGVVSFSAIKPLGSMVQSFQYYLVFSKCNKVFEILSEVVLHL